MDGVRMANSLMVQNSARMPMTFIVVNAPLEFLRMDMAFSSDGLRVANGAPRQETHHSGLRY